MYLLEALLAVLALPVLATTGYLCALALCARSTRAPLSANPSLRFDVVVPAHDEEAGIARTVTNLLAVDYPAHLRRVLVVADNCRDATAVRARAAGAVVLERDEPARVGKGYALAVAFNRSLADGFAQAVVVVDADTIASPNLLRAFAARLQAGAKAVQGHYTVRNAHDSWRTRLMAIAFCLFHKVRSLARERFGVSAGLRGNGMCFATSLLREVPHAEYSIVEDLEYGIRLGLGGHRVHYADDAVVLGDMVASETASRSQRRRWEGGRRLIRRKYARPLLAGALRRRDPVLLDLALDLVVPPLAAVATAVGVGLAAAVLLSLAARQVVPVTYAWAACAALLGVYVLRGVQLAGVGPRGVLALLYAPVYVAWKLVLPFLAGGDRAGGWVRTARERPADATAQQVAVAVGGAAVHVKLPRRER
jgi:glycosyltransferase involved in cell wall biosynthesis